MTGENLPDTPKIDFQIGAPVSSKPQDFLRPQSPVPDLDSIILAPNIEEALDKYDRKVKNMGQTEASREEIKTLRQLHEMYTYDEKNFEICNEAETLSPHLLECRNEFIQITPSDIWDSAYVSIDDNTDTNNGVRITLKSSTLKELAKEDVLKMGPAELEIWYAIGTEDKDVDERAGRLEAIKNPRITVEENYSTSAPENQNLLSTSEEERAITVAMTELYDIYEKYLDTDDRKVEHTDTTSEKDKYDSIEVNFTLNQNDYVDVNSASGKITDVKRRNAPIEAAMISEVQSATESAASRAHDATTRYTEDMPIWDDQKMFGDQRANFVRESKKYWDNKIQALKDLRDQEERQWKMVFKERKSEEQATKEKTNSLKSNESPVRFRDRFIASRENQPDVKLVDKWKKYWDQRMYEHEKLLAAKSRVHDELLKNSEIKFEGNNSRKRTLNEDNQLFTDIVRNEKEPGKEVKTVEKVIEIIQEDIDTNYFMKEKAPTDVYVSFNIKLKSGFNSEKTNLMQESELVLNENSEKKDISETKPLRTSHSVTSNSSNRELEQKTDDDDKLFEEFETNPKRFFGRSRRILFDKFEPFNTNDKDEKKQCDLQSPTIRANIVSSRLSIFNKTDENIFSKDIPKNLNKTTKLPQSKSHELVSLNRKPNMSKTHKEYTNSGKDDEEFITNKKEEVSTPRTRRKCVTEKYLNTINSHEKDKTQDVTKCTYETDSKGTNIITKLSVNEWYPNTKLGSTESKLLSNIKPMTIEPNKIEPTIESKNHEIVSSLETNGRIEIVKLENDFKNMSKSSSTSTMDLWNIAKQQSDTDKQKSCEDFLNVKVKNYISLFENTSKGSPKNTPMQRKKDENLTTKTHLKYNCNESTASTESRVPQDLSTQSSKSSHEKTKSPLKKEDIPESQSEILVEKLAKSNEEKAGVEENRGRFSNARNFFKTLERHDNESKSIARLNECEIMLFSESRKNKSSDHSSASEKESESNIDDDSNKKLAKISEKFQIEDLFNDVAGDGKISRQGSFRGIPNKQAVLATFQSMQNLADHKTSYEMSETETTDVDKDTKMS